ncbi:nitrate ABC transporter ATPase [Herbaspirillum rubrisubalbicans]|jgi:NitT/TauT family transport system ATP-binding protein|uniref:Nitrate ABC transporter ATPase n=2 Tax=Herbaspirillum rubrisubalbicans TaxID=80842 RepID=A0ABX9C1F5_9BURK|nr:MULTISPECIES: ABC transporter ATP-binding protein [Herbaspirillum]NQE49257.1 nitrate ABC transporter ATPase [Herbaspirillum rubrisubalbicans]QJQ00111.1 ABC transporter ATP-binding protein [Herbaspirillum rubrisubalbicans Os34]RAM64218.1 nitrate ABC transporter ATPase [Herbaspirillum rubrisubalbicans]RAN49763.1 nitrate ABC transporter ATPase [Herbaspirillum rubrisubalbicans]
MGHGSSVSIKRVGLSIGKHEIMAGIDLDIRAGEFICLLGPSGCGKSTLLNAIAGFQEVSGEISISGQRIKGPGLDRGVVFQSSEALFPWLTVRENVEYGLRLRGIASAERRTAAERYVSLVGLRHAIDKFPGELSGGMRQRAQIARVLVNEPSVVLMDEPFGALDAQTREVLQSELERIWKSTGCTIVFVTHDIWEAILLADRVVTMTAGPRAHIKTIETVDLPHPRDPADPACMALYARIRDDIGAEVTRVLRAQGLIEEESLQ